MYREAVPPDRANFFIAYIPRFNRNAELLGHGRWLARLNEGWIGVGISYVERQRRTPSAYMGANRGSIPSVRCATLGWGIERLRRKVPKAAAATD